MHYYQFNIADYRKDTGHLSAIEHFIYRELLDWMYLDECKIPKDNQKVLRRLRLGSENETELVNVLSDFFKETADGWIQERVLVEIETYKAKLDQLRENGKKGGRPRKSTVESADTNEEKPNAIQKDIGSNPTVKATNNQEPLTNITGTNVPVVGTEAPTPPEKVKPEKTPPCPHQDIIDLYHETLPAGTMVRVWNDLRETHLRTRWREDKKRQSLAWWEKFFKYVDKSDFLMGRVPAQPGRTQFVVSLDWLVNPQNMAKVIEGKYHEAQS